MRLGQLARQLETKPEKIVEFLEKEKNITVKSHPNAKVEDELIEELTAQFKPVVKVETPTKTEKEVAKKEETPIKKEEEIIIATPEHIETVKVAPVQQLKIIGKIDLPDKKEIKIEVDGVVYDQETLDAKKKVELAANKEKKDEEKAAKKKADDVKRALAKEKRAIEAERKAMLETEKNNMLSKEEEKKKAEALKIQQEQEQKRKNKKKKEQAAHYSKKHIATTNIQKKKKKKITEEVKETYTTAQPEEKLTGFKKFLKWLNT